MSGALSSPAASAAAPVAPSRGRLAGRLPRWLALDRVELALLGALALLSVIVLAALLTRPFAISGVDGGLVSDQLQYLGWIRSSSEHVLIQNLWDIGAPGRSYFFHPGFFLSGLLYKAGLPLVVAYQLLWKPVAVLLIFFAFRAYVHRLIPDRRLRHLALALGLFYVSPFAAIIGFAHPDPSRLRGQLDFMSGELFVGLWVWGYLMTGIAVGLCPLVLLALERARVPERRAHGRGAAWYAGWAAAGAFFASYLQPWQGTGVLLTLAGVEAWRWRREGRPAWRPLAAQTGPAVIGALIPMAYYWWMSKHDPSWELAGHANLHGVGNWPWYAWVLGLLPIAVPAYLGFRLPARDWQAMAVRLLPLALFAEYWLIFYSKAGTFPFHAVQGASLPLAILAVEGLAARRWSPALSGPWVAWACVAAMTLPGIAHKLNNLRMEEHKGGEPWLVQPGERDALSFLERSPVKGGVLAPIYSGLLVPAYTGRETWVGQVSWTRDYDLRKKLGNALFEGRMARPQALRLVRDAGAPWLLRDCFHHGDVGALLRGYVLSERRFGCALVYRVDLAKLRRELRA